MGPCSPGANAGTQNGRNLINASRKTSTHRRSKDWYSLVRLVKRFRHFFPAIFIRRCFHSCQFQPNHPPPQLATAPQLQTPPEQRTSPDNALSQQLWRRAERTAPDLQSVTISHTFPSHQYTCSEAPEGPSVCCC